jgi:hypothetical protein
VGKRAVVSFAGKKDVCTCKEQYPGASQKNMPTISPFYGVNPSISQCCVGDVLGEKNKWDNETCESVLWLKGAKLKDLEDEFVTWPGQMNTKVEQQLMKLLRKRLKYLEST